jgi:acetyl esterase
MRQLHPQILQAMKAMENAGLRPIESMSPAEARAQMEATAAARKPATAPIARIEERKIPGPAGEIRVRLYWPNESGKAPAIAYYHGGGHVIGSLDTHDNVARNLCAGARALVASVDYRMGPEHRFPAAVEDAWAALAWLRDAAGSLGADPARLGVHGDSAGGNLAAVVALMARDAGAPQLRLQSLVYPIVDYGLIGASYDAFATGYGLLTRDAMLWFREHYFKHANDVADWRASPVRNASHAGVAPAIIVAAECDVLHDDGVRYAEILRRAGVAVEYHEFQGMIHAFFGMSPVIDDAVKAQDLVCAAFRRAFA